MSDTLNMAGVAYEKWFVEPDGRLSRLDLLPRTVQAFAAKGRVVLDESHNGETVWSLVLPPEVARALAAQLIAAAEGAAT